MTLCQMYIQLHVQYKTRDLVVKLGLFFFNWYVMCTLPENFKHLALNSLYGILWDSKDKF